MKTAILKVRTICAWCGCLIKEGSLIDGKVSHGICSKCKKEVKSRETFD